VRTNAIAFAAGVLLGAAAHHPEIPHSQDGVEAIELRFIVELTERANDRLLNDIRAFNAVAYALVGPLLAIVALVDYEDRWNALTLAFTTLGLVFAFLTLLSGDGVPTPSIADRSFFDMLAQDPDLARRNIIADLERWGPDNRDARERKRSRLTWAARCALVAIVAALTLKEVEYGSPWLKTNPSPRSLERMASPNPSPSPSPSPRSTSSRRSAYPSPTTAPPENASRMKTPSGAGACARTARGG
jgi:hypothetical protein